MNASYNPALNGIRAVAIAAVLAFHCRVPGLGGGFFGVDLFFVLSGYLITSILADEWRTTGRIGLGRFYWNRLLRLTPSLYLMIIVVAALGLATAFPVVVTALYLGDIIVPFTRNFGALSHAWSLAVEEHFYLIWPVALVPVLRSRNPATLVFSMFLAATVWRIAMLPLGPGEQTYYRLDARLSGLLLGSGVALANFDHVGTAMRNRVGIVSAVILAVCASNFRIYTPTSLIFVQPLVELAAAGLLLAAVSRETTVHRVLAWGPLPAIGLWSYAIYLWHYPISHTLKKSFDWPFVLAVTLIASLALAAATHHFLEVPMRRFRIGRPTPKHEASPAGMARAASVTDVARVPAKA